MNNNRNEEYLKALGKHLREIRLNMKMSQAELSYESDISFNQVGRIERGEVNVTASTLLALGNALERHPSALLDFDYKDDHRNKPKDTYKRPSTPKGIRNLR